MVHLPSHLSDYQQEAEELLTKGLVADVEFSGSTYQVLVKDLQMEQEFWVFIQLEGKGQIKDAFCSCEEAAQEVPCLHLATAYLSLFGSYSLPLHQRFSRSLWNQLCQTTSERLGNDPTSLVKLNEGYYIFKSGSDKILFSVKAKTAAAVNALTELIHKRPAETEETSLEFSNISYDELEQWREGKPSPQLSYNISYWSDLAKWLLNMQEGRQPYDISFTHSKKGLPHWIQIEFPELNVGFHIPENLLSSFIPSLNTIESPLAVYSNKNRGIAYITYNKKESTLSIKAEKEGKQQVEGPADEEQGIVIDGWIYIPEKGFYAREVHPLLKTPVLGESKLSDALNDYTNLISNFLTDYIVHSYPTKLSYTLAFAKNWSLVITAYLFEPGDLSKGYSRLIQDWAFLDNDGFYRLEGKRFDQVETVISIHQVADFIVDNRAWLNTQEGFNLHVKSLEYQLDYQLTPTNRLIFFRHVAKTREGARVQDFGPWVYLEGMGFYSKTASSFSFLLRPGVSLSPEQIPLFIKTNRSELALIPYFFSEECPIKRVGLKIQLVNKASIKVSPIYEFLPGYTEKEVLFFDEFVYTPGKGFYELPAELRLPDKFRHTIQLEGEELNLFLTKELEEIRKYILESDPQLSKPHGLNLVASSIRLAPDQGRGWYRFKLYYQTEKGLIPVSDLYTELKKKQPLFFAFFEAGLLDLRDKRFDWLRHCKKDKVDKETHTLLLSALEFMRLNAFDPLHLLEGTDQNSEELLEELTQLHTPEEPDIGGLISHLRPYQEVGVKWLWFLYHQNLSGLLCDDMGLGKTHQAMALLASIANLYRSYAEGTKHYFLIVCPTSVIYHWQEKLQQFLPGLRVCTFYGTKRSLDEFHERDDILLTSYGVLRNEKNLLAKVPFEVAIFDEIQVAKNQLSRVYATLLQVKAQMKLGLTGTPIENHLRELKSLFDIILPGYMPGEMEYREFFMRPIEKELNPHRKNLLNRIIKPFVLRRKKEDVLKELPEKIEEIAYCDLLPYQNQLYREVLEQRRRHLLEELHSENTPIPYLHIFALLSSLKQICDHPAVYLKSPADYQKYSSGKWDLFIELLREAHESEQKVVVFSQYLGMLDIIEAYLKEQEIGFASLRGSTQNRKGQIQAFNQDPSCIVFVGSLQAAGLGVDLTAGSVVIHYDRWWNAARENQATDRVHRIGQTRGVQVFKLVTKGTFEEKIDLMIERKGRLMEEVVGVDDQHALKKFSREDLIDLLSVVELGEERPALSDSD